MAGKNLTGGAGLGGVHTNLVNDGVPGFAPYSGCQGFGMPAVTMDSLNVITERVRGPSPRQQGHFVPFIYKCLNQPLAEKSGSADDEDVHTALLSRARQPKQERVGIS